MLQRLGYCVLQIIYGVSLQRMTDDLFTIGYYYNQFKPVWATNLYV